MKIGVLNEMLSGIEFGSSLPFVNGENPANGNPFTLKWHVVRNMPFDVQFKFPCECFVDRVEVSFGKNTHLSYNDTMSHARHRGCARNRHLHSSGMC